MVQNWTSQPDEELVEIYCRSSQPNQREQAFSELVDRYHPRLMRRVYSKLHRLEDSEEVMQEFWKDFARTVGKNYSPQQGSLKSWIYGVLHHKIVDFFRRQKEGMVPLLPEEEGGEIWFSQWPGDMVQSLEKCLQSFPAKYGKILCLLLLPDHQGSEQWPEFTQKGKEKDSTHFPIARLLAERPLEEIGESLARPLSEFVEILEEFSGEKPLMATVKTWKHRALQLLQECMKRQGFGI